MAATSHTDTRGGTVRGKEAVTPLLPDLIHPADATQDRCPTEIRVT